MPYPDDELIMISALQHYVFCPRQCALIHVEQIWSENYLTATGSLLHNRVDRVEQETRRDVHLATSLRLLSRELGLTGIADMVEYHRESQEFDDEGFRIATSLPSRKGFWRPFPVEYKRGKPKDHRADEIQLCAQAICLEEMHGVTIKSGALFYGTPRRRTDVFFDEELRRLTREAADGVHQLVRVGVTPGAVYTKACEACSLIDECRPKQVGSGHSSKAWIEKTIKESLA
jgi:CRISPR-associated exonuclease Cas4